VVVVLNIGGVIETASWNSLPDAILLAWQGGQEGGNSVADILSGKVNPSGKLPMTFPIRLDDHASDANFPQEGKPMGISDLISAGKNKEAADLIPNEDVTRYEEGIYVGYRHFDKKDLSVSYPFGYGLSYGTFVLDSMQVTDFGDRIQIHVQVTNSGSVAGKEVVQLYVSKENSAVDRPIRELKAFSKTQSMEPGASQTVSLDIAKNDLRYWDDNHGKWMLEPGDYELSVGLSSRDLRQIQVINLH
jgi:beta-glucosidase